jgi:lipopolysaccharide transport system permease protein
MSSEPAFQLKRRICSIFTVNSISLKMNSLTYHFDLVRHLAWREFTLRYKGSVLGILWSLLPPLVQLGVLVFLFRKVIPLDIEGYPAFVFSGLLPWIWFSTCLNSAGYLFINNRDLVRRPNFEPSSLVTVSTISNLIHFLMFLPILLVLLIVYGRQVTISMVFFPALVIIQAILTLGLGLIIATMNAFYHDVQQIVNVGVTLLFYLTPVFYRTQSIPERYQFVYSMNPIAALIRSYRAIFFYGTVPEWGSLLVTGLISILIFGIGYTIYRRQISNVMDVI